MAEQAHVDRAYARLESLVAENASRLDTVLDEQTDDPILLGTEPGPQHAAVYERDVLAFAASARRRGLDFGDYALCFGRIDTADGDRWYLGRVAIPDEEYNALVVDWRAPVAAPFYRATAVDPLGLTLRRHFVTHGRTIKRLEDERFTGGELGLAGPGALGEALGAARTGKMRDIVATVQKEQDEIIRAPLRGIVVVDGGPGTGKTAVALHRAAYLLYTYRQQVGRILVVGPNPMFLAYIDQVLPALGESGVALSTVADLCAPDREHAPEGREAARAKGDARMAEVVARAVASRQRGLAADRVVRFEDPGLGLVEIPLEANVTREIAGQVAEMRGSHNDRRPVVESKVLDVLWAGYRRAVLRKAETLMLPRGMRPDDLVGEREETIARLAADEGVLRIFDLMWPGLTPELLLADLFGTPELLRAACFEVLSDEERDALARPWYRNPADVPWTAADGPLLEEAKLLIGPLQARPLPDPGDPPEQLDVPVYGHIVVDEAQDLSPMALRVLARRSANGSMTLVGDLAQTTGPTAYRRWEAILRYLPQRGEAVVRRLSVSYRTPEQILQFAGRVLPEDWPHPTTVREGDDPVVIETKPDTLASCAAEAVSSELAALGDGIAAVIAPDELLDDLEQAVAARGLDVRRASFRGIESAVTVGAPEMMKGLEFDATVVVEPAAIVEVSEQGRHALYVALTRSTKRLAVVHTRPLPGLV